jgi:hypothetical protein
MIYGRGLVNRVAQSIGKPGHRNAERMTMLSLKLSRALAKGRKSTTRPQSRAELLAVLLRKRAAAHNAGAEDLEAMLRDQIRWALPIERDQN